VYSTSSTKPFGLSLSKASCERLCWKGGPFAGTLRLLALWRNARAQGERAWVIYRILKLGLLVAGLLLAGGPALATDRVVSGAVLRLSELLAYRLELMPAVAAWKWRHDVPVEDLAREARVLAAAKRRAAELGLDPDRAEAFLQAQITASKAVQAHFFTIWRRDGFPEDTPDQDLATLLRPAIGAAGDAILEQLVLARPLLDDPWLRQALADILKARTTPLGLDAALVDDIVAAAASVGFAPAPQSLLDAIIERGALRVGTTGDYAPFSRKSDDGYEGIDIDLARNLAQSLGVELVFVETSWPTLMADLQAGRYDIGMSGITRTLDRQKLADLTGPYHQGGKAPIVRCGEEAQYDTLDEIDRPETRVVVNPGGTNQAFADTHLTHASVNVFPDNTAIFVEIAAGRADVMVTDRIEVDLQSAVSDTLCPAMAGTFTQSEKAFLMPRDQVWLNYVNAWLDHMRQDGSLAATFARHVGSMATAP